MPWRIKLWLNFAPEYMDTVVTSPGLNLVLYEESHCPSQNLELKGSMTVG